MPPTRRQVFQAGAIGYLGLSLPRLLRADAAARAASADACILVFLNGGPSHLDMWDMKPDAPAEIRGEFKPIATSRARRPARASTCRGWRGRCTAAR